MAHLDVYSRRGCHLCEVLVEELVSLVAEHLPIEIHDIDTRPDWRKKYDRRVPVVAFEGRVLCEYQLDRERLLNLLRELPPKDL